MKKKFTTKQLCEADFIQTCLNALTSVRLRYWGKTLSKFISLQLLCQALQMITALLVVRNMSKEYYAWYTLAFGMQGSLALFSQMGVGTAIHAVGGPRIGDRRAFGEVIAVAKRQRYALLSVALPVAVPVYWYLLTKAGCPLWVTGAMLGLISLMLLLEVTAQMAGSPFALARQYNVAQVNAAAINAIRLALIGSLLLCGFFHPVWVILAGITATASVVFGFLVPRSKPLIDPDVKPTCEVRRRFFKITANSLPGTLNVLFQAQIGVFIIGVFGNTNSIADLGAISRLALLMTIPTAIMTQIFAPRMASEEARSRLLKIWIAAIIFGILTGTLFFLTVVLLKSEIVFILGSNYSTVEKYLPLYAAWMAFIISFSPVTMIATSKGWLQHSWAAPILILGAQIVVMQAVDLGTVDGIIWVKIGGDIMGFLFGLFLVSRGLKGLGHL